MSLHIFPKPNSSFTEEFKKLLTLLLCPCCASVTQLPVQKRWQLWETWRENFRHVESNKGLQKPNMLSFACVSECVRVYACVFVSKWARRGEKLNSLCVSFFFRFLRVHEKKLCTIFLQATFTACTRRTADTACCNSMRVCLYSPWQAASSCWTWHLSRCYQVAEAITPLPGPPGHTVYLSRLGRHQWLGCWLEFALSLLHTVFNLCRCREYMQGCGPAFHSTLKSKYCKRCETFLADDNYKKKWSTSSYTLLALAL